MQILNWTAAISPITGIVVLLLGWWLQKGISRSLAAFIEAEAKSIGPLKSMSVHLRQDELRRRFSRDGDRVRLPIAIISTMPGLLIYVQEVSTPLIVALIFIPALALVAYVGIGRLSPGTYAKVTWHGFSLSSCIMLALLVFVLILMLLLPKPVTP